MKIKNLYKLYTKDWVYYGSTINHPYERLGLHFKELRDNTHSNKIMQDWFNNGGDLFDIQYEYLGKGTNYDERSLIIENDCCNERKPYPKNKKAYLKKLYKEKYNKWMKTPLGKITSRISDSKTQIKKYVKEGRDDMERKWFWIAVERHLNREEFKNLVS